MAVAFLTTRVKKPGEDTWGKLRRCLLCLKDARHVELRLSISQHNKTKWWVGAPCGERENCKGYTGYFMSVGKGVIISGSNKHKSNARNFTKSELVGVDFTLPKTMWCRQSTQAQGCKIEENILF